MLTDTKMEKNMKPFMIWMTMATTAEQNELARRCGTSRAYLYHISGFQTPSPALAIRIEMHTREMQFNNPDLPVVLQSQLSPVCASCPYSKK